MNENGPKKAEERLSEETMQDRVLDYVRNLSSKEVFDIAVAAGIYTPDGQLTEQYRG